MEGPGRELNAWAALKWVNPARMTPPRVSSTPAHRTQASLVMERTFR